LGANGRYVFLAAFGGAFLRVVSASRQKSVTPSGCWLLAALEKQLGCWHSLARPVLGSDSAWYVFQQMHVASKACGSSALLQSSHTVQPSCHPCSCSLTDITECKNPQILQANHIEHSDPRHTIDSVTHHAASSNTCYRTSAWTDAPHFLWAALNGTLGRVQPRQPKGVEAPQLIILHPPTDPKLLLLIRP
jgi:hypothetical protein